MLTQTTINRSGNLLTVLIWILLLLLFPGCTPTSDDPEPEDTFHPPDEPGPFTPGTDQLEMPGPDGIVMPVQVWYPSSEAAGTPYVYDDLLEGGASNNVSPDCSAVRPVLVFSHGNSGIRYQTFSTMEHLASHGYVVVAPDHVDNTFLNMHADLWPEHVLRRPLDIAAAFDGLLALNSDETSDLHGCVDAQAGYAVMGHSFGGFTTYGVAGASIAVDRLDEDCQQEFVDGCVAVETWLEAHPGETQAHHGDDRVWAAIPWAPAWHGYFGGNIATIQVPTMVIGGDRDTATPWDSAVAPSYDELTVTPRYLAELTDTGHYSFTDMCALFAGPSWNGCGDDFRPYEEVLQSLNTVSLSFLMTVQGEDQAFEWLPPETGFSTWEVVED